MLLQQTLSQPDCWSCMLLIKSWPLLWLSLGKLAEDTNTVYFTVLTNYHPPAVWNRTSPSSLYQSYKSLQSSCRSDYGCDASKRAGSQYVEISPEQIAHLEKEFLAVPHTRANLQYSCYQSHTFWTTALHTSPPVLCTDTFSRSVENHLLPAQNCPVCISVLTQPVQCILYVPNLGMWGSSSRGWSSWTTHPLLVPLHGTHTAASHPHTQNLIHFLQAGYQPSEILFNCAFRGLCDKKTPHLL